MRHATIFDAVAEKMENDTFVTFFPKKIQLRFTHDPRISMPPSHIRTKSQTHLIFRNDVNWLHCKKSLCEKLTASLKDVGRKNKTKKKR